MAEEKFSQRRESKHLKNGRNQKAVASNILEAIAQLSGGDAAAEGGAPPQRMKIVVKKEDLKQVLEAIRNGRGAVRRSPASTPPPAMSLEQRLSLMRRRQILRQVKSRSRFGSWRPVLQSIPE